jgi:AcrR family transcriptional regulator
MSASVRPYRQNARAAATNDTRRRIVEAFEAALRDRWMDDVTLDQVAAAAGTTRRTVIRLYGGKEGLLKAYSENIFKEVLGRRALPRRPVPNQVARALIADYEVVGDLLIRLLAQEDRHPVLGTFLHPGRTRHRAWIADVFASALPTGPAAREARITQLVIATDVYSWKLLRRDLHLPVETTEALIGDMIAKLLREEERR